MNRKFFAGLALAFSLLAPAFSAPAKFDAGTLQVKQISQKGPALVFTRRISRASMSMKRARRATTARCSRVSNAWKWFPFRRPVTS